jgi:probable rRNA maturation factor
MESSPLDLAYSGPDLPLLDPFGESHWQHIFELWLSNLQSELAPELRAEAYSLGLQLCNDEAITALNANWRAKPEATDVLAFPAGPQLPLPGVPLELGDIVISLETAARQAPDGLEQELCFLASHGLLHLLGWDHPDQAQLSAMLSRQQELIELFPNQIGGIVPPSCPKR